MSGQLNLTKRRHLLSRLRRATLAARELLALCRERGTLGSHLEADAYVAWLEGLRLVEDGRDWEGAVGALERCVNCCLFIVI